MKLKTDENGNVVVQDGKPVYVHDDGKEIAFDAPQAMAKIGELNRENRTVREAREAAEATIKAFEGLDPAEAREALDKIGNIDAGKLQSAEAVERRVAEAVKAVELKYEPILTERDSLKGLLDKEVRGGAFARSKFAEEKVAVPRHMLERTYGDNFKIEDGKLVPYDAAGNKLFSRARPGEIADFDEALELLISSDPYKDHILKSTVNPGGGAPANGAAGGSGGAKTLTRAQFDAMSPQDKAAKVGKEGFTVVD